MIRRKSLLLAAGLLACLCAGARNERYVNLFLGSEGDHGQTTPAACVPFGMVAVCPDSDPPQHGGYDYAESAISGISINRISGVGCGGAGSDISIFPGLRDGTVRIRKETEKAGPGWYGAAFDNGVRVSLTATRDAAIERYRFPGEGGVLSVNFRSSRDFRNSACGYALSSDREIRGFVEGATTCSNGRYKFFFTLSASAPFTLLSSTEETAVLSFAVPEVEIRIGINAVSPHSADLALEAIRDRSFRSIRAEARRAWRSKLDKIRVSGGDREQRVLFYTSLYRVYLSPFDVTSRDGFYRGTDGEIHSVPAGHSHFSCWSMWDTFRTKFPMLVLLEPELMEDICASAADLFVTGKNGWATEYESVPTVRTEHTQIMLLDAFRKGIPVPSLSRAFPGMLREARKLPRRSLDNRMETSYDLWALGEIAGILGETRLADSLSREAEALFEEVWRTHFMEIDTSFTKMKLNGLYQGTKWQYRWAAPQYAGKMAAWKGADTMADELQTFFDRNLFNQGNEPDLHAPFLFGLFSRPERTSQVVSRLLTDDTMIHIYGGNAEYPEPYVGRAFRNATDGYAPEMDEDDGAMSAWYMFAQMGFYPVVVGEDRYEVFSPLFDRIVIRPGGRKTIVRGDGRKVDVDDGGRKADIRGGGRMADIHGGGLKAIVRGGARKTVIRTRGARRYTDGTPPKTLLVNGQPQPHFTLSNRVFSEGGQITLEY